MLISFQCFNLGKWIGVILLELVYAGVRTDLRVWVIPAYIGSIQLFKTNKKPLA